jgi:hypothetical protein
MGRGEGGGTGRELNQTHVTWGKKKLSTVMERSLGDSLKLRDTVKRNDGKRSLFRQ